VLAHPAIDVLFFHQLLKELEKPKENLAGKLGNREKSQTKLQHCMV